MENEATEGPQHPDENLRRLFEQSVNRHGHPFQYAVIRRAEELVGERKSKWVFQVPEFPVEVRGLSTRIDFILCQYLWPGATKSRFLVAECKRANPSISDWLFVHAPYTHRADTTKEILVERVRKEGQILIPTVCSLRVAPEAYHLSYEVKGSATGDASGSGRGAIEEAATQVLRGTNGLIECLSKNLHYVTENSSIVFIPAIFTTAKLWATDVDIASDTRRGLVDLKSADVVRKPWLWYQYHVSPGLKHPIKYEVEKGDRLSEADLSHLLRTEFSRTIAVVGSDGIDQFLTSPIWNSRAD